MAREEERPRPYGDPLRDELEPNAAQRQSDAPPDATSSGNPDELTGRSDRDGGRGSTANGIPAFDSDAGKKRRKQYDDGAEIVSGTD